MVAMLLSAEGVTQQKPFPVVSDLSPATISGRAVNLDVQGKLLPWPMPNDTGYSYSGYFESQWAILWDQYNRQRLPYFYCCVDFDRTTFELMPDKHWANSTAYLRAMTEGFLEHLYAYSGDPRTLVYLQSFVDYELEHGLTPEGYVWSQVPYASANPGALRYTGWSNLGEDYIEPHVVGEDGYAYLRLYELTGKTKYLRAAIRCAEALAKNYAAGDEAHSPWPVRCYARDGKAPGGAMGPYSANVVEPMMLFDELIRLGFGNTAEYQRVRNGAWDWFQKFPLATNTWVGYFEDTVPSMGNMNQVIPLEFARYVLLHPDKDPQWKEHARKLIEWVKTTPKWPKYMVHGAMITNEQGNGINFCCSPPNDCCDSHTARLAALEALYYAKTGETAYRDAAYRSFNWVSYFQGLSGKSPSPFPPSQWWFTDEFSDGPRRMMDSFWAVPEWAPAQESHVLGGSSVVTHVEYATNAVTYSTFDAASEEVLRLDFKPDFVTADGKPLALRKDLEANGYTFDDSTKVMRIRHEARNVDIEGSGGAIVPVLISFDDPHLPAGTVLKGQYPSGVIDWGDGQWRIHTPEGAFGTFNLAWSDSKAEQAVFRFYSPRIFVGVDVYNGGSAESTLTIRCPELPKASWTIAPGEVKRIRTGWIDPSSFVTFETKSQQPLQFDNLAYRVP